MSEYSVDIEVYDRSKEPWAQARYLVHGRDDVLWTDDVEAALAYLRADIERGGPEHTEND